ncbi:hypothetical protein [Streptosporangium sp. NPDC087985]|uniref:hypothetical protein n=1 Tax=Streptosporangium sp. NPDC087985 TaxID=3366196 RepID=UPI00380650DA
MDLPVEPVSDFYGYDRGTPIDRHYIEAFLGQHADRIAGHVAEIKDDTYACRFGAGRPHTTTVIDIDPGQLDALDDPRFPLLACAAACLPTP